MKIKIQGFRCHVDSEYKVNDGKLILLKGSSGSGKTTILQAIYWCLFGGLKNVYNNNGATAKCGVTLEFSKFVVYRQKKPELLRLTIKKTGDSYEDDVAQKIIDQTFGNKDLWMSCSYIQQGQRCALLSGSNNERMELLNQLSFNMDEPENYINKINNELKELNTKFTNMQTQFNLECERFKLDLDKRPVNEGDWIPQDQLTSKIHQLQDCQVKHTLLTKEVSEQQRLKGVYSSLSESLTELKNKISRLPVHQDNELATLKVNISAIEQTIIDLKGRDDVKLAWEKSNKQYLDMSNYLNQKFPSWQQYQDIKYTDNDVWTIKTQEHNYNQNVSKCSQIGYTYKNDYTSDISVLQTELDSLMTLNQRIQTLNSLKQIESQIKQQSDLILQIDDKINQANTQQSLYIQQRDTIKLPDMTQIDQYVQDCSNRYGELVKASESLSCPHCGKMVKYLSSKLYPVDVPLITQDQLSAARNDYNTAIETKKQAQKIIEQHGQILNALTQIESNIQYLHQHKQDKTTSINNLSSQAESLRKLCGNEILPANINIPVTIKELQTKIGILSSITWIDKPQIPSDLVSCLIQLHKIKSDLNQHDLSLSKWNNFDTQIDISTLNRQLISLKTQYDQTSRDYTLYQEYKNQLTNIENRLNTIILRPQCEQEYQDNVNKIKSLETCIDNAKYADVMINRQNELEKTREHIYELYEDITALQKLHQTAITVECKQLQETVDSINTSMSEILTQVFEDPISVTIQLYRILKNEKRAKPSVNLSIQYRGAEYDGINQLSGGEGDRVSLALILALNRITSSPFLFLDEPLSSIGYNYREMCIKAIKSSLASTKTVLCICHEDVEGHYDDIINVH